jgi:hypothetical protein
VLEVLDVAVADPAREVRQTEPGAQDRVPNPRVLDLDESAVPLGVVVVGLTDRPVMLLHVSVGLDRRRNVPPAAAAELDDSIERHQLLEPELPGYFAFEYASKAVGRRGGPAGGWRRRALG